MATVMTESSVKKLASTKRGNFFVLVAPNSWTDPMMSPAMAPIISLEAILGRRVSAGRGCQALVIPLPRPRSK